MAIQLLRFFLCFSLSPSYQYHDPVLPQRWRQAPGSLPFVEKEEEDEDEEEEDEEEEEEDEDVGNELEADQPETVSITMVHRVQ